MAPSVCQFRSRKEELAPGLVATSIYIVISIGGSCPGMLRETKPCFLQAQIARPVRWKPVEPLMLTTLELFDRDIRFGLVVASLAAD